MLKNRLKDPSLLVERAYIDGQWVSADNDATLDVINPATGECLARVPALQGSETRRAIEAAERAWPAWRARPAAQRAALLERWYEAMLDNLDDLALIMTCEQGKPLAEAKGEVTIKDLRLGTELAANIASREEYAAQRLAQVSVPEAELVAQVKKMLG